MLFSLLLTSNFLLTNFPLFSILFSPIFFSFLPFHTYFPLFFFLFLLIFPSFLFHSLASVRILLGVSSRQMIARHIGESGYRRVRTYATYQYHWSRHKFSSLSSFPIFLFYFPFISSLTSSSPPLLFSSFAFSISFYPVTEHTITFLDSPIIYPALSPILLLCPIFPYL